MLQGAEAGEPLVFLLLASHTTDNWRGHAQMLLERVPCKETNVIALSLVKGVSVQKVRSITTVPLLVMDDPNPGDLSAFFGWVEQAVWPLAQAAASRASGTAFTLAPLPSCLRVES